MVLQAWSHTGGDSRTATMPTPTSPSAASGADRAEMVRMSSPENNGNGPSTSGGHQSRDGDSADSVEHQDTTKKKKVLSLGNLKAPFKFMGTKIYCKACKKKCSGEVLRVADNVYFHPACFRCHRCQASLAQGGFFTRDGNYFCSKCYHSAYGTKCAECGAYVEGEVVSALGKTYCQGCFACSGCRRPFPTGERVTFTGKECLCQKCVKSREAAASSPDGNQRHAAANANGNGLHSPAKPSRPQQVQPAAKAAANGGGGAGAPPMDDRCAGCAEDLKDGQALMALDKQYHVWCFKCHSCQVLLHGEYMGKDGRPYCERDYQREFGVKCTYCRRFISGKVLQAGDNNHFHPTCARCTKCGEPFGDGEEMFLQGAAIWHPRCGPGPNAGGGGGGEDSSHYFINGFDSSTTADPHMIADRSSVVSGHHQGHATPHYYGSTQHFHLPPSRLASSSRASSPGASLRRGDNSYYDSGRFSRSTMHVSGGSWYPSNKMYSSSSTYSLRRPIEPGDRVDSYSSINHFHLPPSRRASSSSRYPPPPSVPTSALHHHEALEAASGRATPVHSSAVHRPISCPPKPGYTQAARSATLPADRGSAISPGPGMHFNDFDGRGDDVVSQQSFATDRMTGSAYGPRTSSYARGHHHQKAFAGEHKVYPLHVLFTTNYKLPPDLDRCNLEKHLSDADFEMAFNVARDDFYRMPIWKRNDLKKRVRLF